MPPEPPDPPETKDKCVFCHYPDMCFEEDEIRCSYCGKLICLDCSDKAIRDGKYLYCSQACKEAE
jgi:hypothetical protein